ncbi:ABC transporter substrate-binding protein [Acidimangrovimonas sediminis]|uniref:ABC transporter substrate-binding protein n=1 Tax=Acidimangrovimonas sediminis TaxID=2056283 RepID=UPI000C7FB809|nr:ABC transporter substrate-binding protein [Acidimangrovimonas sediminis]
MSLLRHLALGAMLALAPALAHAGQLVFAWSPNPQTPQVDVALEKGYFKDAGLDVKIVPFNSGRAGFEALLGGQVDVAFMAEFPAATGALMKQKFVIVGDLARFTGSRIIGNRKAGPLTGVSDLAGRKIGTTIGTNVHYFLDTALAEAGVKATIVSAAPSDLVPAVSRGDVDAIAPFPTFYGAAKKTLGANYEELRVPGYKVHFILAATPAMTGKRAADLKAFMAALKRADRDVAADPKAAMAAVAKDMNGAMSPDALAAMWKDVDIGLTLDDGLTDLILSESNWILKQGVVRAKPLTRAEVAAYMAPAALDAATN